MTSVLITTAVLTGLLIASPFATHAFAAPRSDATAEQSARAQQAAMAAVAVPVTPNGLPTAIEDLAPYVGQVSCDPRPKAGTLALARLLTGTYGGTGYLIERDCGSESIASEHVDGRAVDWIVSARTSTQKAQAEAFLAWLLDTDTAGRPFAPARRLGVMYVIWNNRIWSSHDPLPGWQPYSTCATHPETSADDVCHRSRLHVSLSWAGALAQTSYWSKKVAATDYGPCRPSDLNWAPAYRARNAVACPSYSAVTAPSGASATAVSLVQFSGATVAQDDTGPVVAAVQRALGVTADGVYGPFTADAVAAFQTKRSLPPSGSMDAATWRELLVAVGARTSVQPTLPPAKVSNKNLLRYKNVVLKYGDRGAAVLALQKRLKVTPSGWFGPKTRTAVVAFQVKAKLKATGIVNATTWVKLAV